MNITYKDSEGKELKYFTQWDINRTLELDGITGNNVMIHFYNRLSSRALVVQPKKQLEKYVVNVPNILLQEPCDIMVAVFVENGEEGKTEEIFSIPVEAKTKPEDYTFEENIDYINWVELNEQSKKQLEELQRLTKEIQDKYDSGAFKGDKGDRGVGIKSISKIATNGLKDTYRILFDDGKTYDYYITNGKTPVKGVDYYTIAEKEQLVNEVIEDSTNKFNTNVTEKTNTFNSNASQKLQDYNSNHNVKFKTYNDNADTKYNDYNSNATTKTNTYNTNATERLNTYNKNAETKFNTYNDNATTKFNAYNTNDETKTTAYNNNAIDKLKEYNDNTTAKIEEYNTNATTKLDEFNTNASDYNKRITNNTKRIKTIEKNIFDSGEAEGESLNIPDTALAEFQEIEMNVNKAQNTTKGYNLAKIRTDYWELTTNGIKNKTPNAGRILFTMNCKANTKYTCYLKLFSKPVYDTTFTGYKNNIDFSLFQHFEKYNLNTIYKNVVQNDIDFELHATLWGNPHNDIFEFQMWVIEGEESAEQKPYEIYTGGMASPNLDYPQPINTIKNNFEFTSCGKNLFDIGKDINDYFSTQKNGVWILDDKNSTSTIKITDNKLNIMSYNSTGYTWLSKWVKMPKNHQITITANTTQDIKIVGYHSQKKGTEGKQLAIINKKENSKTFNSGDYEYYSFSMYPGGSYAYFENLQLEVGTQATPYEPYKSITNVIDLKGNEFLPRR